ncbi:MAG: hypothetical protein LBB86_00345 [Oscillospiraceae bacterium]|jgi:hypothetical protein|nr:hypothetical protein [Oscillospiraceae bacterium]
MPVIIRTEQELLNIRGGQEYSLASNIILTRPWKSVDADDLIIHGNGYSIQELTAPLLGSCSRVIVDRLTVVVKLDLTGANPAGERGEYMGGLICVGSDARIEDCVSWGSVRGSCGCFAGLCGHLMNSAIRRCANHASVTYVYEPDKSSATCGGLIATAIGSAIESSENATDGVVRACDDIFGAERAGGIAAAVTDCTMLGNVNRAAIIGSTRTGGVAGTVGVSGAGERSLLDGNINYSNVTGQRWFVGGIAGEAGSAHMASEPDIILANNVCYGCVSGIAPSGVLTGEFIGGIVGFISLSNASIRDNAVYGEAVQGLRFVHRILGSNQSRYTSPQSPSARVALSGNAARADLLLSGDNLFVDGPKALYYNRCVSDDDPQSRADGLHGESVSISADALDKILADVAPAPSLTPYTAPSFVIDNAVGEQTRSARFVPPVAPQGISSANPGDLASRPLPRPAELPAPESVQNLLLSNGLNNGSSVQNNPQWFAPSGVQNAPGTVAAWPPLFWGMPGWRAQPVAGATGYDYRPR